MHNGVEFWRRVMVITDQGPEKADYWAMNQALYKANALIAKGCFADAVRVFDHYIKKQNPTAERPYLAPVMNRHAVTAYAHALLENGKAEAAFELLAPHVTITQGRPGAFYVHAATHYIFALVLSQASGTAAMQRHIDGLFSNPVFTKADNPRRWLNALRLLRGNGGGPLRRDPQSRATPGTLRNAPDRYGYHL